MQIFYIMFMQKKIKNNLNELSALDFHLFLLGIKKYDKSQKLLSNCISNIKKTDKIRESKSQLKLEKFFKKKIEYIRQIITYNYVN